MLIVLGFYKRKPGLSHAEFSRHWRDVHGPLIRNHPVISTYMRRYLQHHLTPGTGFPGVGALDYDGFSESWWDSLEARQEAHGLEDFKQLVIEDERQFIDMDATRILMFDNQNVVIGTDHAAEWMARRG
ncbi:EthD domain-containing protein [Ruixingdingia sedimenti]|uniref:EthD domain-containing protein n=1 Tax=Ruixingdingia sedimenti TaxID=3073604 RepID=A0ABU1F2V5_9RHOB|nr:EthD domain-containing protein [Xinfangfangia sp. LG-4]MDR5651200.1 EthD domain-containing protein [Xinfangfangia sp. LG-4]